MSKKRDHNESRVALNKNAKTLLQFCPEIVNDFADRLVAECGLMTLVKSKTIRTPEDLRQPMQIREE